MLSKRFNPGSNASLEIDRLSEPLELSGVFSAPLGSLQESSAVAVYTHIIQYSILTCTIHNDTMHH